MARRWSNLKHGMSSKWFQALWEPQRCILVDKPTGKHTVSAVSAREACSLVCVCPVTTCGTVLRSAGGLPDKKGVHPAHNLM